MPRQLTVEFIGDTKSLERAFGRSEKASGKWGKKIGGAAKVAGLGIAAGVGLGVVAVKDFAQAASDAEVSNAKMRAQLKASGLSYRAHAKEIEKVIQKTSQLSGLDDEDLQNDFTNIVRVTGDVNKSLRLTGLAADFARAKHIDVAKAGELVGKVAGGNTGILARYGITLDKGATSTEALAVLQKKFAGQAKAYGDTSAGASDRFKVAVENLKESLGAKLLPIITKVTNAAARFVNGLISGTGAAGGFGEMAGKVFGKVRDVVGSVVGFLGGLLAKHRGDLKNVSGAIRNIGTAVRWTWEEIALPIVKRVLPAIKQIVTGVFNVIGGAIKVLSSLLTGRFGDAWDGVKQIFKGGAQIILGEVRAITAPLREIASKVGNALKKPFVATFNAIKGAVQPVVDLFDKLLGVIKDVISFLGKIHVPHISLPFGVGDPKTSGEKMAASMTGTLGVANRVAAKFGLRMSSGYRDPMHNAAVGGVPGSLHTHGSVLNPGAIDLVGPVKAMYAAAAWAREHLSLKELLVHDAGSGLHLHMGFFKRGGKVPGAGSGDKVPAMLEPGEFVMRKSIVDRMGPAFFAGMNRMKDGGIVLAAKAAKAAGFSGKALVNMVAIAGRESSWNPGAQNLRYPDHSIGLWQINQLAHHGRFGSDSALKNAYTNAKAAYALFKQAGYSPWGGRGVSPFHNVSSAMFAAARKAVASLTGKPSASGGKGVGVGTFVGDKPPKTSKIGISSPGSTDSGGGLDDGGTGPDPNIALLADLTAQMVANQRRLIYLSETQGPQVVGAVVAAVNGHIGGKVGLGFSGIRSPAGSVAGL